MKKKSIWIVLAVLLSLLLAVGLALGKYVGEWKNSFALLISPFQQQEIDTSLRRYFRSNELKPISQEIPHYEINGTTGWFTVANGLDSATISQDNVSYTLTWYVSQDGSTWTEADRTEHGTLIKNVYQVVDYNIGPMTIDGVVYDYIQVVGKTTSFKQEDIQATYHFTYYDYVLETTYNGGVVTLTLDTNDMFGDYQFRWPMGMVPDNSDPNLIFTNAVSGPGELTAELDSNTLYEFHFFVTDDNLFTGTDMTKVITVTKK